MQFFLEQRLNQEERLVSIIFEDAEQARRYGETALEYAATIEAADELNRNLWLEHGRAAEEIGHKVLADVAKAPVDQEIVVKMPGPRNGWLDRLLKCQTPSERFLKLAAFDVTSYMKQKAAGLQTT